MYLILSGRSSWLIDHLLVADLIVNTEILLAFCNYTWRAEWQSGFLRSELNHYRCSQTWSNYYIWSAGILVGLLKGKYVPGVSVHNISLLLSLCSTAHSARELDFRQDKRAGNKSRWSRPWHVPPFLRHSRQEVSLELFVSGSALPPQVGIISQNISMRTEIEHYLTGSPASPSDRHEIQAKELSGVIQSKARQYMDRIERAPIIKTLAQLLLQTKLHQHYKATVLSESTAFFFNAMSCTWRGP